MAITKIPAAGFTGNNFRNIIINGDMSIAQRGTTATGLGNTDIGYHTVDRWKFIEDGSPTYEFTMSQDTDVPTGQGFAKSLKLDITTAQASLSSTDALVIAQSIEGQNLQYLKKGTSSAESLTASFWVKSNKTGTYILMLDDIDNGRSFSQSYTISSANTWEKKTLTYAGDTTGVFDNDNAKSLELYFWLAAGSTYSSGSLQTSWGTRTNANMAPGQVNLADDTANDFYITGVQLEAASAPSDFEFLPYDMNLQRCQRYFQYNNYDYIGFGFATTSSQWMYSNLIFATTMRATPSVAPDATSVNGTTNILNVGSPTIHGMMVYTQSSGSNTDIYVTGSSAIISANAEL